MGHSIGYTAPITLIILQTALETYKSYLLESAKVEDSNEIEANHEKIIDWKKVCGSLAQ